MKGYDIIGDVHGCADKLVELLLRLGYTAHSGFYNHSERQAIFVGDLHSAANGGVGCRTNSDGEP